MYKVKLLFYVKYRTAAIYNACDTVISRFTRLQNKFLSELGMLREDAMLDYNLAHLESRRDIAMLGLIHQCVLGNGPLHFKHFCTPATTLRRNTRSRNRLHSKTADGHLRPVFFWTSKERSVFGLIWVYNKLTQDSLMRRR